MIQNGRDIIMCPCRHCRCLVIYGRHLMMRTMINVCLLCLLQDDTADVQQPAGGEGVDGSHRHRRHLRTGVLPLSIRHAVQSGKNYNSST